MKCCQRCGVRLPKRRSKWCPDHALEVMLENQKRYQRTYRARHPEKVRAWARTRYHKQAA